MIQKQRPQPQTAENPSGEEKVAKTIPSNPGDVAIKNGQQETDKEQLAKEAHTERD